MKLSKDSETVYLLATIKRILNHLCGLSLKIFAYLKEKNNRTVFWIEQLSVCRKILKRGTGNKATYEISY